MINESQGIISFADFTKVDIRVGTVLSVELNLKAINPSYKLTIDFGLLGIKKSSAQITQYYNANSLIGMQILAVINLPSKNVAGVISEVLVLALVDENRHAVLVTPTVKITNGLRLQ